MHALLVTLDLDAERAEEVMGFLNNMAVPMIKQAPGFVSGTWVMSPDRKHGHSLHIFDSEEAARAGRERAAQGPPPGAPISFVSAEVFEVVAQA